MTYTELLDRFWGMDREFSCLERTLYFYLLHCCNELGWPDTFSLSNEELVERLKCCRKSISAARSALVSAGLLQYQARFGRGDNSFYRIVVENNNVQEEKWQNGNTFNGKVAISDHFSQKNVAKSLHFPEKEDVEISDLEEKWQNGNTFSSQFKTEEKKQTKKKPLPAPTLKEKKKEKKKENTRSLSGACAHTREGKDGQTEIVFKEIEPKPLKKKREPVEPVLPKDMLEVLSFFETKGRELLDWKAEAEAFFYHFDSVGWMGTSNRKIIDWKSRAHLWIADKTVKEKQQALKTNGTTKNQSGSTRESRLNDTVDLIGELLSQNEIEG